MVAEEDIIVGVVASGSGIWSDLIWPLRIVSLIVVRWQSERFVCVLVCVCLMIDGFLDC